MGCGFDSRRLHHFKKPTVLGWFFSPVYLSVGADSAPSLASAFLPIRRGAPCQRLSVLHFLCWSRERSRGHVLCWCGFSGSRLRSETAVLTATETADGLTVTIEASLGSSRSSPRRGLRQLT